MPLGQRDGGNSESRYCGVETEYDENIQISLQSELQGGFDFVLTPLTDPTYRPSKATPGPAGGASVPPFAGSDLVLSPAQWSSHIVGKLSTWLDLDSPEAHLRADSEIVLKQELSWASHLSLQACMLPTPRPLDCANYARCVNQLLQNLTSMQLWLRIPLVTPELQQAEGTPAEEEVFMRRDPVTGRMLNDSWEWWNAFRMLCEHHSQLSIALDITASLPPPGALERWLGEPVRAAILHTSAFLTNKRGYPCLSKRHQNLIALLFDHSVQVVVTGGALHEVVPEPDQPDTWTTPEGKEMMNLDKMLPVHPLKPYLDYFSYRDFLQAPLQPLMDNLEAQTYETFEKDATKYSQYQEAVRRALVDRVPHPSASTPPVVLMVVGAGRGPLVRASLRAAEECGRKLKVYAVEKNPNAIVTLHSLIALEKWEEVVTIVSCDMRRWHAPELADILVSELLGSFGDNELSPECLDGAQRFLKPDGAAEECGRKLKVYAVEKNPNAIVTLHSLIALEKWEEVVTIVSCDMRRWHAPELADILVSELLGSFGDNELSPECLDGAQRFLKPDGVSIPSSYTSFIAPITASKLHNDVKAYGDLAHFETAYVVKLHSVAKLCPPQPVFTFEHPNREAVIDNTRAAQLLFDLPPDTGSATVHGFGGYFDAVLYKDVHLSIEPSSATPSMFSWFPIFFPLRQPLYVPGGSQLAVHFWRCVSPSKVWYEWAVSAPSISPVHNPNGRSYSVGL
eukprot:jgi/Mesen1/6228/ME000320S05426